jgi:tyrosinase
MRAGAEMAQFDASKTVNNILSGSGDTAQEHIGTVIRTAADLAKVPGVDMAKLAKLPGLGDARGVAQDLGGAVEGLLGGPKRQAPKPSQAPKPKQIQRSQFNPFDPAAARGAVAMASKLMEIADRKGGDAGLADAIGALGSLGELTGGVSGLAGNLVSDLTAEVSEIVGAVGADALGMRGLRQHALALFITHYPPAREKFKVEPLEQRQPNLVRRSGAHATPEEENLMSFWREDAQLNDHHGHWHTVNPVAGRPVAGGLPDMGNRHGELFAYMHEQMLARYDAERLGVGLRRVEPFDDYGALIPQGYDPGDLTVWNGKEWVGFRKRPENVTLSDFEKDRPNEWAFTIPGAKLEDLKRHRKVLLEAAKEGQYKLVDSKDKPHVTSDNLGDTVEANILSVDYPVKDSPLPSPSNGKNYGNLHGDGHVHFAYFDSEPKVPSGVMLNLDVTARDPMFWRWHKNVDTIIQTWRETLGKQQPYDFADGPQVTVRSEDIILCRKAGLPNKEGLPAGFDDGKLGAAAFGYSKDPDLNHWDNDFSSGEVAFTIVLDQSNNKAATKTITTTAELMTEMRTRTIQVQVSDTADKSGKSVKKVTEEIDYLSHEDFFYFLRLQNRSEQAQQVTIRIFLAPEPWVEDNTAWIELDRFLHRLGGGEHAVVFRPARLSAVIRKPAVGHEELESTELRAASESVWCDCGWPYTLLLPRSTKEGLDFRLLVMLSSEDLVMTDTGEKCTSMSYCGLQDKDYPDKRPMGYPFDRALTDSIDSIINKHENWASRKIRIRCHNL